MIPSVARLLEQTTGLDIQQIPNARLDTALRRNLALVPLSILRVTAQTFIAHVGRALIDLELGGLYVLTLDLADHGLRVELPVQIAAVDALLDAIELQPRGRPIVLRRRTAQREATRRAA